MEKHTTTAAAATILACLAGALSSCSTQTTDQATTGPTATSDPTQHVTRVLEHGIEHHVPKPDHYLGVDRLRSPTTGKIVGYDNFAGFSPNSNQLIFWMTLSLNGGLIDTYFHNHGNSKDFTGQITQGSGKYRGITGTIHVQPGQKGNTLLTLHYNL
jgi:hypothetical protein